MGELLPIVHPGTGEVVDLKSAPTDTLAQLHDLIADRERDLRSERRAVDDELVERMDFEGKRTFHGEGFVVEVSKPTERQWDVPLLRETLDRLVVDGIISETKSRACLKVEHKPVAGEIRPLESDPRTTRQIRACYEEVPSRRTVRVKG